ncbi:MAG: hypothetical protein WBW49_18085 [Candidatus Acidiferrum sp.]
MRCFSYIGLAALLTLGAGRSFAQGQPVKDPPAQGKPAEDKPDSPQPKDQADGPNPVVNPQDKEANDEVPKRIFWIIPNFMTYNDQPENQGPLTVKQKYNIAWLQFWDLSAHFGNVLQASISQAANGLPHYGQGWGPFGERYLAQEGDQFTGSMLIYGVLPSVLHDDPRYFRKGRGKAWSRIGYAASRVIICRTDSGKTTFNFPSVFGQLGQATISATTYYPKEDRKVEGVVSGWLINQGYNIGWNQLKEFTPDLGAYMKRHSKKKKAKANSTEVQDSRSPLLAEND